LLESHPRLELKDRVAYRELINKMDAVFDAAVFSCDCLMHRLQVLQRDSNINVSASAARALKGLANGMRFDFQPFAPSVGIPNYPQTCTAL
jgi:hypothetical protein